MIDRKKDETIEKTIETDEWTGLAVNPHTKSSRDRSIKIINKYRTEHTMINSAADWGISTPLSVPLIATDIRKEGFNNLDIEHGTFYKAYEFYTISSNKLEALR